jgi:hypothetical protein
LERRRRRRRLAAAAAEEEEEEVVVVVEAAPCFFNGIFKGVEGDEEENRVLNTKS